MKYISSLMIVLLLAAILINCGESETEITANSGTKKYLAENIIFNATQVSKAYAGIVEIDTQTKISADNVLFKVSDNSSITAQNVQAALEEISLKLVKIMPGTWDIQNYNQENLHSATGKISINSDGTFDLTEGSFAAIGMGSDPSFCDHTIDNQTYEFITGEFAVFTHFNPYATPPVENKVIPQLIKLGHNEMVFLGSGGCGYAGRQRISVLTRYSSL
ncbi:MAG: hypothetical protein OEV42_20405 [Deltaproteobacteria bacterium]|nr:hypothetical protein [Deltaproteobacteria bacterium]